MTSLAALIDFDAKFYREENKRLFWLSARGLSDHYFNHGYYEGRMNSALAARENFLRSIESERILEIGPFFSPCFVGKNVEYIDVLDTDSLRERARKLGLNPDGVPNIHYVAKSLSTANITKRYKVVFSSHNIEHQPDLISHLNEVSSKLEDDGIYAMIIPNARYCFDANLPLTKISEVLNAYFERRAIHTVGSLVEHRALTTHNDAGKHWAQQKKTSARYAPINSSRVSAALKEFVDSNGQYIDVHAWQFDPFSFADIIKCLIDLKLINFSKVQCNGPVYGRNEFTVKLLK
jgi:hypothetical protein